ncbi:MAG: redoxin domain-containing protein [Mycobacteriales bacterium]
MRPRRVAAAAAVLAMLSATAVGLALRSGRTPEQLARVIGLPPPPALSPTTTADLAPELEGIAAWHNTAPLTLKALRGKVVLIDFWTYSCINCRRMFPLLRALHERYADDGLVVIGVHSPEFDFEKSHAAVARAVRDLHVTWPVAEDPDQTTWAAYGNEYWPADYVVDREGRLREHHVGESAAGVLEGAVRRLLAEGGGAPGSALVGTPSASERPPAAGQDVTPELYLGALRGLGSIASPGPVDTTDRVRRADPPAGRDLVSFTGVFTGADDWVAAAAGARVEVAHRARDVYITARSTAAGSVLEVRLGGKPVPADRRGRDVVALADGSTVTRLGPDDLRHLLTGDAVTDGRLSLTVRGAAAHLYTFTFGG